MRKVYAITAGGKRELASRHGGTVADVMRSLTASTLTGSAVPLDDAELETADGQRVRYGDVAGFEEESSFLDG